ncbi:MAG: hypothetical protein ABSB32_16130 [Thermodesulfobacteriota bacterium]|jgi:hypothetical protein
MFLDFREYLDYLEKKALLARIKKEVETSWTLGSEGPTSSKSEDAIGNDLPR